MTNYDYIIKSTAGNWFGFYGSLQSARDAKRNITTNGDADGVKWPYLEVWKVKQTNRGKGFVYVEKC